MFVKLPWELVNKIDSLAKNKDLEKADRDSQLEELVAEAWNILFPEGISLLPVDLAMRRWQEVRSQLENQPNKDKILRILESQASGERLWWLD